MTDLVPVHRALISLSDKTGLDVLAAGLATARVELVSTGGTAKALRDLGHEVRDVADLTGFPEMMDGRVKTLHPMVHGGLLAVRDNPDHVAAMESHGIGAIDLVVVNLYPFEQTVMSGADRATIIENIDIGGPSMVRSAAKNHAFVACLTDPADYPELLAQLDSGGTTLAFRKMLAAKAYACTAAYDSMIASWFAFADQGQAYPEQRFIVGTKAMDLRYGENPHQKAALYARAGEAAALEAWKEGKELSYNNLLDLEAAVRLVSEFEGPACVIVKHCQPCGAASAATLGEAYAAALRTDELSAFGGIVAFNRALDGATATEVAKQFVECVAAPELSNGAAAAFAQKKNVRLVRLAVDALASPDPWSVRHVGKWALLQREDPAPPPAWRSVTKRAPGEDELRALRFAWSVVGAARSNAIAIARGTALIGLGSGQTSRVDAVDVALMKAKRAGYEVKGGALASDGFFPFADNIEHAAEAGITAIAQPGGSMRDAEVVEACDRHRIAMMFTDRRVFRH